MVWTLEDSLLQDDGKCVRFYDKEGNHRLSLLPCGLVDGKVVCVDLCRPSGKVLYCGVQIDLVNVFVEALGLQDVQTTAATKVVTR